MNKAHKQVVIIMTDTQRQDMLGCYKRTGLSTPCLDSLAEKGVKFTKAYTVQPVCAPARGALFTGMLPHTNGVTANSTPLYNNAYHIADRLKRGNIQSAYIGKWHLDGGDYFGTGICPASFDKEYWYDMRNYLEELTKKERVKTRNPGMFGGGAPKEITFGHRCVERAIKYLEEKSGEDFFLTLSFDEPHGPSLCPEPFYSMYKDFEFPKSENLFDTLDNKPEHQRLWAEKSGDIDIKKVKINTPIFNCNSFIDYEIGRVLGTVWDKCPDAIVIYTSDHGDYLYSHGLFGKGPAMYDETNRIPLLIAGRDVPQNAVCDTPVSHLDIAPTVMRYFGFSVPGTMEGEDITRVITNPEKKMQRTIFMEFTRYESDHDGFMSFQPIRACFDGRYKLVINLMTTDELYDLDNDPEEMINLIENKESAKTRDELFEKIIDKMNKTRDPYRGYYWEERIWRKSKNKSWDYTGYTRQREEPLEPAQLDYDTGLPMKGSTRVK